MVIAAAPTLNAVTYVRVSVIATSRAAQSLGKTQKLFAGRGIAIIVAWCLSWVVSWKLAIDVMLLEYSKLPMTDPNCYVSSAAASGHRRFVGAECSGNGIVNRQMQRLKFLEFALATAFPRCHKFVRLIYNSIGPKLACYCALNVWFADVTFWALKPIEWAAVCVRVVSGVSPKRVEEIYLARRRK